MGKPGRENAGGKSSVRPAMCSFLSFEARDACYLFVDHVQTSFVRRVVGPIHLNRSTCREIENGNSLVSFWRCSRSCVSLFNLEQVECRKITT